MSREALFVRTLVELADSLVDDFDVIDVLTVLANRCVEGLDVSAAGVLLAAPNGELQVIASSSDTVRILELFELQANEGPAVDCYRTAQPIVNLDLATLNGRWPRFTARAILDGFRAVHALPMRLRGSTLGALNMFRTQKGELAAADVLVAQALADVATIAILQHRTVADAMVLTQQLTHALNSRIIIEQAKGKISEALQVEIDQAFQILRQHARSHKLRLTDLSSDIADGTMSPRDLDRAVPRRL